MPLGAEESQGSNRIYVSLRTGKICQTDSKKQPAGFKPAQTQNKDKTINNFFAKEYDHLTGYVTDVRWHTHKLNDGTVLSGWNVTIDTTKEVYVLQVSTNDRPFERFMNVMLAVDFEKPVRFVAFMGKHKQTGHPQKVLLLTQQMNADGKPIWLQPITPEKWLSRGIINKLKQNLALTEAEENNISRMADGTFNKEYPYIVQGLDEKWSMDAWRNFLLEQVHEFVIPNVQAANAARGVISHSESSSQPSADVPLEDDSSVISGPPIGSADDDIPF